MTIFEQVDAGRERPRYSWLLTRSYHTRAEMERWGWRWIKGAGCRGCYVTTDPAAVARAREVLRLAVPVSNGTHERTGFPMHSA